MKGRPPAEHLAYAVASSAERRAALATTLFLLTFAALAIPFGHRYAGESNALLPAVDSASLVAMFISAAILRNQYRLSHFAPFAFLAVAYACTAALLVPYMLFFPHVFSPNGFGAGPQAAAWLWVGWHAAFVLCVAAYVWSESYFTRKTIGLVRTDRIVRLYVAVAACATACAVAGIVALHAYLPVLVIGDHFSPLYHQLVEELLVASAAVVLATLVFRTSLRYTTHLWLGVVLISLGIEIYLSGEIVRAHYTVAWYMGLVAAVVWQGLFLVVQLRHASDQLVAAAADKRSLVEETLRDALTALYNRRGFNRRFEDAMAQCRLARAPLALLALDLDHFKAYNDHYGHVAGDEALRRVGAALASVVNRPADACCRVGGEEFAIVLPMTDLPGASAVAERVRAAVIRLGIAHAPHEDQRTLTVSIGIAVLDGGAASTNKDLYERADRALYRAKRLGRNRIAASSDAPRDVTLRVV